MKKKVDPLLPKLLKKKRRNKNDAERIKRLLAEIESKARRASEKQQERIKVLWDLDEQQLKAAENPQERKHIEQKLKEQKLKKLLNCIKDLAENNQLADQVGELVELVELAGLQNREIEYLTQFRCELERIRDYDPEQLENLSFASVMKLMQPGSEKQLAEEKPKKAWERKRGSYKWCGDVGLIEYEFGGAREAELRKNTLTGLLGHTDDGPIWQLMVAPTCLDNIFAGGTVHMDNSEREVVFLGHGPHRILEPGLQLLFGMDRNRFPNNLRSCKNPRNRRERLYDWHAVVKIMGALLGENAEERKGARRPLRRIWLSDPADPGLRTRALSEIEARVKTIASQKEIVNAFVTVLRRHLPNSAKK